jgi:hypothetical protein
MKQLSLVFTVAITCLVLTVQPLLAQQGVIRGRVTDAATNEPIPFATVLLSGTTTGTTTDDNGRYTLENLEPGRYTVEARLLGYQSATEYEIAVTNARPAEVNFALRPEEESLEAVEVVASPFSKTEESPVSLRSIGPDEIRRNPGGNRDISKAIRSLPGAATVPSFRNDIIIRGGAPSENVYFLDGIEVPVINHFQTQGGSGGPVGLINVDFIREVNFYAGAFPANRGGALSSIFAFEQRPGRTDEWVYNFTLGATDLAALAEGPIGDSASIIASVRRSYLQFLFKALELPFLPIYNDYQVKAQWQLNRKNRFTLVSLGAIDNFELNLDANDTPEQRYILNNIPVNEQWNYTIGGKWEHFRDNGYYTVVLSRNMLDNRAYKFQNNIEQPGNELLNYQSQEIESKLRLEDYRLYKNGLSLTYGAGYEYTQYSVENFFRTVAQGRPLDQIYNSELDLHNTSLFAQASQTLGPVVLSAGARMDASSYSPETNKPWEQFSPRISAAYNFRPRWSLNANVGRYYQLPSYITLGFRNNAGELVNRQNGIRYLRADHAVLGLEHNPGKFLRLTLEGFYKWYDNYPFLLDFGVSLANLGADFGVVGNSAATPSGRGRAYGLEFLAQQKLADTFYGTLAYTLVRSEFTDASGTFKPSAWDFRHVVSLTGGKRFRKNWELGARFLLSGGPPFTPFDLEASLLTENYDRTGAGIPDYTQLNTKRLKEFHQLDLRLDKRYFFNKWSLNVYFDVQNVYGFGVPLQPNLDVVRDDQNRPIPNPNDPNRYQAVFLDNVEGTTIPTLGIIVEL